MGIELQRFLEVQALQGMMRGTKPRAARYHLLFSAVHFRPLV